MNDHNKSASPNTLLADANARKVIVELERLHPEISWSAFEIGDYDQYAELSAPDILVSFGSEEQELEGGLVDAYADIHGNRCEPSHWGLSEEAARLMQDFNQVFMAKYPCGNAPRSKRVSVTQVTDEATGDITHCQVCVGQKIFDAPFTESSTALCNRVFEEADVELTVSEVMQVTNSSRAQMYCEAKRLEAVFATLPEGAIAFMEHSGMHYWLSSEAELLWAQWVNVGQEDPDGVNPGRIEEIGDIDTEELYAVAEEIRTLVKAPAYQQADIAWLRATEVHIKQYKAEAVAAVSKPSGLR